LRLFLALSLLSLSLFAVLAPAASAKSRTVVSIEFDDAYQDQWNVRDDLKAHGVGATFFINSSLIGTPGYMTLSQLLQLQGDGHEMGGHTRHHAHLTDLSNAMQIDEICGDRTTLNNEDLAAHDFAYPDGAYDPMVQAVVKSCGYNSARTVYGLTPPAACKTTPGCRRAETIPATDLYATLTVPTDVPPRGFKALQSYLLSARKSPGRTWVQFVFHHVCDGCNANAVKPKVFRRFLDWLGRPRIAAQIKQLRVDFLTGLPGPGR
jgi:peptidoglycan/xylan/chitin deacetylase (PgdA/CDA1 family)